MVLKVKDITYLLLITIQSLLQFIPFIQRISGLVLYKSTITRSTPNLASKSPEFAPTTEQSFIAKRQLHRWMI